MHSKELIKLSCTTVCISDDVYIYADINNLFELLKQTSGFSEWEKEYKRKLFEESEKVFKETIGENFKESKIKYEVIKVEDNNQYLKSQMYVVNKKGENE